MTELPNPEIPYEYEPLGYLPLSRGPTAVRKMVSDFLEAKVPDMILRARQEWGLPANLLPMPVAYHSTDPMARPTLTPVVGVLILADNSWEVTDWDQNMGLDFSQVTYDVRVFFWVTTPKDPQGKLLTPGDDTVVQLRDDLLTVIRATILLNPSLATDSCTVQHSELNAEYFGTETMGSSRFDYISGGAIAFPLQVVETVSRPPLSPVEYVEVEVGQLPPNAWELLAERIADSQVHDEEPTHN